ncbi:hypothetical protein IWQ60_005669 [Tieghemiomyces parasiticus]|uniref:Fungal lipase-type domain-containing protein n=1 Tax=Tieghemiomyces parasiticus TaxID=78921 RepID=A0A9W8DSV4_9FUNG|nr:hypothetical protein IWQ60_005669 [Tieghemiomyces parasiticus]
MRPWTPVIWAYALLVISPVSIAKEFTTSAVPETEINVLKVYAVLAGISYKTLTSWDCESCSLFANTQLVDFFESKKERAVGYVAVNNDLKQVTLAFRGTDNAAQYITDLKFRLKRWPDAVKDSRVHHGFLEAYQTVADNLYKLSTEQLAKHSGYNLTIVGHSLGAALASLASVDFVMRNKTLANMMTVTTFGQPRVGNKEYVAYYNSFNLATKRVVNKRDPVPHLPPRILGYRHTNEEFWIKPDNKDNQTIACPEVDNETNPDCSRSVKLSEYERIDHSWAWNIPL